MKRCLYPLMRHIGPLTLGCLVCRADVTVQMPDMASENPTDHAAFWIHLHYKATHPQLLGDWMHRYLQFLFAKAGLRLP